MRARRQKRAGCGIQLFADHEPQSPSQWEAWFTAIRTAIAKTAVATQPQGRPGAHEHNLVHAYCLPTPEDDDDTGGNTADRQRSLHALAARSSRVRG